MDSQQLNARIEIAGLKIARELHDFMRDEALPSTGIGNSAFRGSFSPVVHDLSPSNRDLLAFATRSRSRSRRPILARLMHDGVLERLADVA
ncbi:hypothetical protein NKH17_31825 [Mesorhizobium sp. M1334]|uniref:hypothetical protein n=1 Tax=Mesorhizobium sp. M1334 TaxID=2957084 RepID=UPI0033377D7D